MYVTQVVKLTGEVPDKLSISIFPISTCTRFMLLYIECTFFFDFEVNVIQ